MNKFVIIGAARSGTNYLVSNLHSHSKVICHGEIFSKKGVMTMYESEQFKKIYHIEDLTSYRNDDPKIFLHNFWDFFRANKTVGFKMFVQDFPEIQKMLIYDTEVKIILLERINKLASFSSVEIGKKTNIWQTTETEKLNSTMKVPFVFDEFVEYLSSIEDVFKKTNLSLGKRKNVLSLKYEYIKNSFPSDVVCDFLEIRREELTTKLIKQNTKKIIDRFTNPEDVEKCLLKLNKMEWKDL